MNVTDARTEREAEGAWARLRRRKVVQWGITYAAGAWGLLQGFAYVTDTFHWPEYIQQSATLALLIGLPIALVIAWYHGDREKQRPVRNELAIIALLLLLGGVATWFYGDRGTPTQSVATSETPTPAPTASSVPADSRPSIAVLPFENRSRLEDDAFFVDGIHDDILTQLTKIGAMKVIARTSIEQFRDTRLTTREIGEKLGAGRIPEGGVQLVRVGRFDEAGARFRKVIEIDRETPFAYLGIALIDAYVLNRYADAVALVTRAGDLDPGDPFYPSWLVAFHLNLANDAEAFRILESARKRWPGNGDLLERAPFVHLYRGDAEAALQDARRLLALDPGDPDALRLLRDADLRTDHADDSRARYATAYPELLAPQPPTIKDSNWVVAVDLALVLQMTGEGERASLLLDRSQSFIRTIPRMGPSGYRFGDAQVFALRGQKREALAALRAGQQAGWRADWRYYRDFDPTLAWIRNEREFKAVFADIERDMARQRAALASRSKDAPLDVGLAH